MKMVEVMKEWTPAQLFIRFTEFYRFAHREFVYDNVLENDMVHPLVENNHVWGNRPEYHLPLAVLNNGDCGVAALAVGEVLKFIGGYKLQYQCNGGHYYLYIGNYVGSGKFYFDTIYPYGVVSPDLMLQPRNPKLRKDETIDVQDFVYRALRHKLDIEFIEQFVRFFNPTYTFPYDVPNTVEFRHEWYYEQSPDIDTPEEY